MKVVVTGAAGFIGSNLCRFIEFHRPGVTIVGIDDLSSGSIDNLSGSSTELVVGSILDEVLLRDVLAGSSAIVHLAARPSVPRSIADPIRSHEANATGTIRVLDAARALDDPLVIVASSSSVYGANPALPKSENLTPMPMSPYAVSKLATEQYALAWQYSYGMRTLAFRFFNVFGPNQAAGHAYAAAIPAFVAAAIADEPITINGDGEQSRDFTFVETLCAIIDEAIQNQVTSSSPVNLAFGTRTTLVDVVSEIESILGRPIARVHSEPRVGDVRHSQADNALLRSLFPSIVPIELRTGLERTIEWTQAQQSQSP
jgi:UDP-glucose 4-epimerase